MSSGTRAIQGPLGQRERGKNSRSRRYQQCLSKSASRLLLLESAMAMFWWWGTGLSCDVWTKRGMSGRG